MQVDGSIIITRGFIVSAVKVRGKRENVREREKYRVRRGRER